MIDPALWASVPYGSKTALVDFAGMLELYHRGLADAIYQLTGTAYRRYPLGDAPGSPAWLEAVQAQYVAANSAIGLAAPPDLSTFDLNEEEDHASFFFTLAEETRVLRNAAQLS